MYDLRWIFFFMPYTNRLLVKVRVSVSVPASDMRKERTGGKKNVKTNAFIVRSYTRCRLHTRVAARARASFPSEWGKTVFLIFPQCLPTCGRPVSPERGGPNRCSRLPQFTRPHVGRGGERQNNLSSFIFYNKRVVKLYQISKTNVLRYRSIRNHGDRVDSIQNLEFKNTQWLALFFRNQFFDTDRGC